MYQLQTTKKIVLPPASYTNGATAALTIDTLGFDAVSIDAVLSASNNATNVPSVFNLQTADVTNASSFGNVTANGAVNYGSGTSNQTVTANSGSLTSYYTTANTSTSAADVITYDLALVGGKQRYLKVSISPVTTQTIAIVANLYRGAIEPATSVGKNVQVWATL
jgi:hypothetical protein